MAEDLQYAHAGGQTQNKEQYIAAVTKGPARYESFTFSDLKIKLYGKAAVLTGFVDVKMVGQDISACGHCRCTRRTTGSGRWPRTNRRGSGDRKTDSSPRRGEPLIPLRVLLQLAPQAN